MFDDVDPEHVLNFITQILRSVIAFVLPPSGQNSYKLVLSI